MFAGNKLPLPQNTQLNPRPFPGLLIYGLHACTQTGCNPVFSTQSEHTLPSVSPENEDYDVMDSAFLTESSLE